MSTSKFAQQLHKRQQLSKFPNQRTFAALRPVVDIPRWAIATFHGSRRVHAFAFTVAAAVAFQALVHV